MSKRYTPEEKQQILDHFAANGYHTARTAIETGVPERTLQNWKRQLQLHSQYQWMRPTEVVSPRPTEVAVPRSTEASLLRHSPLSPPPPPQQTPAPDGSVGTRLCASASTEEDKTNPPDDFALLTELRDHIVAEMRALAADLRRDIHFTSPQQRATMLFQFIDRLQKLDAYLPTTRREQVFRIEYVDPDGSIHNKPFWARDNEDDSASSKPDSYHDGSTSKSGRDIG